MKPSYPKSFNHERRQFIIAGGQLALGVGATYRLYHLQVANTSKFNIRSNQNRIRTLYVPAQRGYIYDSKGHLLAYNEPKNALSLLKTNEATSLKTLRFIQSYLPSLTASDIDLIIKRLYANDNFQPMPVNEELSNEQYAFFVAKSYYYPDIILQRNLVRKYTFDSSFSHLMGYTGLADKQEKATLIYNNNPAGQLNLVRVGKIGLEQQFNSLLMGTIGYTKIEVNSLGQKIRETDELSPVKGDDLELTIHADLQNFSYSLVENQAASIILSDIHTGDLLVCLSSPGFSTNKFFPTIPANEWNSLLNDEKKPFINRPFMGLYPPGSALKMIVALIALERKLIRPTTTVTCTGKYVVGDNIFHCHKHSGHGKVDLIQALQYSCDPYFYHIGELIDPNDLVKYGKAYGLNELSGLNVPVEKLGFIYDPIFAKKQKYTLGNIVNMSIGQGDILCTPIQLNTMTARIANGRFQVKPRLIQSINNIKIPVQEFELLPYNLNQYPAIIEGLYLSSNRPGGSGFEAYINDKNFKMVGKTGTAQVRRITLKERETGVIKNENLPYRFRDHGLFTGYFPFHKPKYAITVVVEHGGGGGRVAAPIAKQVALKVKEWIYKEEEV